MKISTVGVYSFCLSVVLCIYGSMAQAAEISVGVSSGGGYGRTQNIEYVPGHWYHGYWIPGQYAEYAGTPPGEGYVWYEGSYQGDRRNWRHGHWEHRRHR